MANEMLKKIPFKILFVIPIILGIVLLLLTGNSVIPLVGLFLSTTVWLIGVVLITIEDFQKEIKAKNFLTSLIMFPWYCGIILFALAMLIILLDQILVLGFSRFLSSKILNFSFLLMWIGLTSAFLIGFLKFVLLKRKDGSQLQFFISAAAFILLCLPIGYVHYILIYNLVIK